MRWVSAAASWLLSDMLGFSNANTGVLTATDVCASLGIGLGLCLLYHPQRLLVNDLLITIRLSRDTRLMPRTAARLGLPGRNRVPQGCLLEPLGCTLTLLGCFTLSTQATAHQSFEAISPRPTTRTRRFRIALLEP
jgi:hypothetical protein